MLDEPEALLAKARREAKLERELLERQATSLVAFLQEIPATLDRLKEHPKKFETLLTRVNSLSDRTKTVHMVHWYIGSPFILTQPPRAFHAFFLGELYFWLREDGRIVTSPMAGDATARQLRAPTREYDITKLGSSELKELTARLCGMGV
jgi:hypothetical protein